MQGLLGTQLYSNLSSFLCSATMRRTVPLAERITTVSVSMMPWPNLTPRSMRPSVTPVAAHHVLDQIFLARILDAHLGGALALLVGVDDQPALHLAADAAQRRRRQHTFGR